MTTERILDIRFFSNDLNEELTISEYLKKLLTTLWIEEESFDSKRPFGNSGWQYEIYGALIKEGVLSGTLDEEGFIDNFDQNEADEIMKTVIDYMCT